MITGSVMSLAALLGDGKQIKGVISSLCSEGVNVQHMQSLSLGQLILLPQADDIARLYDQKNLN